MPDSILPASGTGDAVTILPGDHDLREIPDIYNTGCDPDVPLTCVEDGFVYRFSDGRKLIFSRDSTGRLLISLYKAENQWLKQGGEYHFSGLDFSGGDFAGANGPLDEGATLKLCFDDCRFFTIGVGREGTSLVSYAFEDSTLVMFSGSNASFLRCFFGGHNYRDAMNPFQNVYVQDCFVGQKTAVKYDSEMHTDGVQIFGYGTGGPAIVAQNLHFENFRVELPAVEFTGSAACANSLLMISLDYNDAENISFERCFVNGGVITVTLYDNPKHKTPGFEMRDIVLRDIYYGSAYLLKPYATAFDNTDPAEELTVENMVPTGALYVASARGLDDGVHLSVTNDTPIARKLLVMTDQNTYIYTIPACPLAAEFVVNMAYEQFPFDLDVTVPEADPDYVVCYDVTYGEFEQIRFVNYTEGGVAIPQQRYAIDLPSCDIIARGIGVDANRNLIWTMYSNGTLVISGKGDTAMWSMSSSANRPFYPYREAITRVVFEEGVTSVGSAFLYDLPNLTSVEIPASVTFIGGYAFSGCSSLGALHLPYGLASIGGYAFRNCSSFASVSIPSTLTDLGTRAFAGCSALEWVTIAAPLTELKGSTFDGCTSLEWIALREGLVSIGGRDFYNCTSLSEIRYTGDPADIADVTFPDGEAEIYHRYFYEADVTQITLSSLLSYEDATEPDDLRTHPTVTISDTLSKTYDGCPVDRLPQFSSNSDGAITVSWRQGAELCATPPTLPGIYTVVLDVAATAQHYGGRFTLLFEIGQAQGIITLQSTALGREADGTPVTAPAYTYNGDAPVRVSWLCGGAQLPEAPSLPGAYTLRVYAPETLCYSAAVAEVNFVLSAPAGITIWDGSVATDFAGGSGTAEAPYLIADGAQLALLAQRVTEEAYASAHYRLTHDIYLNDCLSAVSVWAEATPDNMWSSIGTADAPFAGVFDGAGHSIFGLYVSTTNATYACGLFGCVVGGTVKNLDLAYLSLNAPNRSATCYAGAVMAYGDGVNVSDISISECYITAARMGGGLIGALKAACGNSSIEDCMVNVVNDATGIYSSNSVGGVVGTLQAGDRQYTTTLRNITVNGSVAASSYAGGMIGRTESNVGLLLEDCTNRAAVSVTDGYAAGMVTTLNNTTGSCNVVLRNCVNHGAVTAGGNYAAGMICTATTRASTLTLVDCTNHGAITAADYAAGVLCILTANSSANAAVSFVRVSSDGVVSGGTHAAALVAEITGDTENPYVTFEDCD